MKKTFSHKDTMYTSIASPKIVRMTQPGKAPKVTISLNLTYNIGHLDLAGDDNTYFRKSDFVSGRNFGTRYGYGVFLTGKIAMHKAGNLRLNVTGLYQRFQSNFVISGSPEGRVAFNVFGGALGIENNFNPDKKLKPYIGADIVVSSIFGNATLATDSTNFELKILNSVRIGAALNFGFELAFNNRVGMNLGYRITYANIIGKKNKTSSNPSETYLNDEKLTANQNIPFAGWKQFLYSSFYGGITYYFGMKAKK